MNSTKEIIFNGRVYQLHGKQPEIGKPIPEFEIVLFNKGDAEGTIVNKENLLIDQHPLFISVTTSLDTPIGKLQTKKLNDLLKPFSDKALIWSVSSDLPFNINRFFDEEDIEVLSGGSDYLYNSFGKNFGVMIEEVNLLARAVFVIDRRGVLRHSEIPEIIQSELDYQAAINVLSHLIEQDTSGDIERSGAE